jgi:hypothetical protein
VSSTRVVYSPHPDATPEAISALANVYRFILDCRKENAAGVTSTNGDARVRNTKEVSYVDQQPN